MSEFIPEFTPEQLEHYRRYEVVRASGRYNMLHSLAAMAAGLTHEEHLFVVRHFDALEKAYEQRKEKA